MEDLTEMMMAGLDKQGALCKVRAQIKASVYSIMDNDKKGGVSKIHLQNSKAVQMQQNSENLIVLQIIREFLQFFDLEYTLSVFNSECNMKESLKRSDILDKISINKNQIDSKKPILSHLFKSFTSGAPVSLNPQQSQVVKEVTKQASPQIKPVKPNDLKSKPSVTEVQPQKQVQKQQLQPVEKYNSNILNQKQSTKKPIGEFEEIEEDDMMDDDFEMSKTKRAKDNGLYTSSEDFLASQSQGFDVTVDSMELEQYDHIEEVQFKR